MAAQSMMMGDAFGKSFQYGKRKISAMTNEEFNAMGPDDLAQEIVTDYKAVIRHMPEALKDSRDFQALVFEELGEIVKSIPDVIIKFFGGSQDNGTPPPKVSIYDWAGLIYGPGFIVALLKWLGIFKS